MKNRSTLLFLVLVLGLALAPQALSLSAQRQDRQDRDRHDSEDRDFSERDEIRKTYELSAGARVEVKGINGTVDIETTSGSTAEVHVVRSARNREDLEYKKIIIEHTPTSLIVRGEKDSERERGERSRQVRHRVTLRIPRQVDLSASGINGRVNVGEVDGPVELSGINGRVDVAQAKGYSDISGINGRVAIKIAELGSRGIQVSGVNGGVELRFVDEVNADVDVSGINGSVDADVPNVSVTRISRNNYRARIGAGGAPINVSGVNGRVMIARVGSER